MFSQRRILFIEDEPLVLEMFEAFLAERGFDVCACSTAKDALQMLERSSFDAVVTDVCLDSLDGFDVVDFARKRNRSVGVVFITGSPSKPDAKRANALSAEYLSKPLSLETLLQALDKATVSGDQQISVYANDTRTTLVH